MIYQQTDSQGFHIGQVAEQAPGAIDAPAPEYDPATQKAKWDGDKWVIDTIENWDKPAEPTPDQLNHQRISEIKAELQRLDLESVRPLRAINAGTDTEEDRDKLAELDSEAEVLRQELAGL